MFIGYEVKNNQNQAKPVVLEKDIKLSQAALDPSSLKNKNSKEPVCLMAEYEKKQFILAVLDPSQSWQCPLDLVFSAGSQIKLFIRGSGTVHLTGYEHQDFESDLEMSMSESDLEEDSDDSVAVAESKPQKKEVAVKEKGNSAKKIPITNGTKGSAKKTNGKAVKPHGDQASDDSDDSDDDDYLNLDDDDDDDDLDESDEDEEMDDDDDDDDDLGDLDEEDEDSDDEEE